MSGNSSNSSSSSSSASSGSASSSSSSSSYEKIMSKKWCGMKGLRLNPRRFSVQRLRTNFLCLFRVLKRWKNSYRNCLRLLLVRRRRRKSSGDERDSSVNGVLYGSSYRSGVRTMAHSNSFCSEAIADCLEFIKRNSVSIDDDRKPMLDQVHE